jgi:hypothetical protein
MRIIKEDILKYLYYISIVCRWFRMTPPMKREPGTCGYNLVTGGHKYRDKFLQFGVGHKAEDLAL